MNKSPLRYPGGKTRACKQLDAIINENFEIKNFKAILSPFFGGGSFEFYLQHSYNLPIIANDKFTPLYNFWSTCKNSNGDLCKVLYAKIGKVDKATFNNIKNKIMSEVDAFQQSIMYFIINRCSFSGATLSGGFSKGAAEGRFTNSSIDRIKELNLANFEIHNLDFVEFLNERTSQDNLLFLDPPYYLEQSKLYGKNGDMHENFDHVGLYNILRTRKNWIMTYNNCDYIKTMYKDYKIIETSWSYGMNKSKESSEIVILNQDFIQN